MIPFELAEPGSLKEAIGLIDADDPTVRPIAGGTALMLMMKAGVFQPRRLGARDIYHGADTDDRTVWVLSGHTPRTLTMTRFLRWPSNSA